MTNEEQSANVSLASHLIIKELKQIGLFEINEEYARNETGFSELIITRKYFPNLVYQINVQVWGNLPAFGPGRFRVEITVADVSPHTHYYEIAKYDLEALATLCKHIENKVNQFIKV